MKTCCATLFNIVGLPAASASFFSVSTFELVFYAGGSSNALESIFSQIE